jgi:putative transposase
VVASTMDLVGWLRKHLEAADTDLLREMVLGVVQALMGAEADALCGAGLGERSRQRVNQRNGYRERRLDTRVGTLELAIPKLRAGSYYPDWLLEPRRRAERALVAVVAECYVRGVSTRRVEGLVATLGIQSLSKSQVSGLAKTLDSEVAAFRARPLDAGPYPYVWVDALAVKCREAGRIVNVACVVATGVNADGYREILGVDVLTSEDGAGWTAFLRDLVARGLSGVELVVSDAHAGLREAIAAVLPGSSWQRCRTHFIRNLLCRVPKSAQGLIATLVRSIFAQPDATSTWAQHARVVEQLTERFPRAAELLADAAGSCWLSRRSQGALAPDLVQQPPGAAQQGTAAPHRRGRDLSQPRGGHPPGGGGAGRAARRVGRGPPLHERPVTRQDPHPGHRRRERARAGGGEGVGRGRLSPAIRMTRTSSYTN